MVERLFKFSALQFEEGHLGFQSGQAALVVYLVVVAGLAAALWMLYKRSGLYGSERVRTTSLALRLGALALLAVPLFEPVLITPFVVADENFVAVVVDGSDSMSLPDGTLGETRSDDAQLLLNGGLLRDIREHFKVRTYSFAGDIVRTDSFLSAPRKYETDLTAALDRVLADFAGLPLTGIVLLTDGGDESGLVARSKAEELSDLGIGLHVVGLGQEDVEADREILDVAVSEGVGETAGVEIDVKTRSWADESGPVTFRILDGDRVAQREERMLKGDGRIDQFAFFFARESATAREYSIEIEQAENEFNPLNNRLDVLIDTHRDTLRVLWFEGHLRQEFKFVKRALEDDIDVDFTSITRTGTGKLYRQGIHSPNELSGGFPTEPSNLYGFRAVIFGDVEASAFTPEQLRLVERFVRERGGGFLMTGGRRAFAEGTFMGTPVEDLLPVDLDATRSQLVPRRFTNPLRPSDEARGFTFEPTAAGLESSILRFSPDPATNRWRWTDLPLLTSINYLGRVKPGAQVLAEKPDDMYGASEPLLIAQRYGKGRALALATSSTWRWQMMLDAHDMRHERFWQQLVRWLAASAPSRVNLDVGQARFAPGDEVPVMVSVYDAEYRPIRRAVLHGTLVDPSGNERELRFDEDLIEDGSYSAMLAPRQEGIYELTVSVDGVGRDRIGFLVRPSRREFQDAAQKRLFLEDLATSPGRYYTAAEAGSIPENLRGRRTSTSVFHLEYLWDMPLLFALVLTLLCAEWIYRRRKGLA